MSSSRPLIGVISDRREFWKHQFHMVGEKYVAALVLAADVLPVAIPSLDFDHQVVDVLQRLDGIFLTGNPSNVEPHHYQGQPSTEGTLHDPQRDKVALELIPAVIEMGLPLFAVCRGFQEMNVAFGGTLHQLVHEVPGYMVHKEDETQPYDVQYGPAHRVDFVEDGLLRTITGKQCCMVNSLHSQAVDQLGPGLKTEALAEDGLVEAFSLADAPAFAFGVQWHPEWKVMENLISRQIFSAFGDACREFRQVNRCQSGIYPG
jgi:putative glutamine amidotransferase